MDRREFYVTAAKFLLFYLMRNYIPSSVFVCVRKKQVEKLLYCANLKKTTH